MALHYVAIVDLRLAGPRHSVLRLDQHYLTHFEQGCLMVYGHWLLKQFLKLWQVISLVKQSQSLMLLVD